MKYFEFTFVPNKTDHPVKGAPALVGYVAFSTPEEAKADARKQLRETLDPENCMCYKPVRLKDITEEAYFAATGEEEESTPDVHVILMCRAMYGEQAEYDEDERESAAELLAAPEDEPETYALYEALRADAGTVLVSQEKSALSTETVDNSRDITAEPDQNTQHTFATALSLREKVAAAWLYGSACLQLDAVQIAAIASLTMDDEQKYAQNTILALSGVEALKSAYPELVSVVVNSVKSVWPPLGDAPDFVLIRQFTEAYLATAHPEREKVVNVWKRKASKTSVRSSEIKPAPQETTTTEFGTAKTYPLLDLEIACALWPGDVPVEGVPGEVLRWAKALIKEDREDFKRWSAALRCTPNILRYDRNTIFGIIREVPDADAYQLPTALKRWIANYLAERGAFESDEVSEAGKPEGQSTVVPLRPETVAAPETTETDRTGDDTPLQAEEAVQPHPDEPGERAVGTDFVVDEPGVDNPVTGHPVADDAALSFLRDLLPESGVIENGAAYGDIAALNARLAEIPATGSLVLFDLSNALYHGGEGYSSTQVRLVRRGGTAALDWYRDAPRDESNAASLSLGTAVHTALLEPERYKAEFICTPEVNLRTNDGKAERAAFEAKCNEGGLTILTADECRKVRLMRDSALAYPTTAALLQSGIAELSVFYRTENGVLLKVRPDWLGALGDVPFLMDVKTTGDFDNFGKSVEQYGYHVQSGFYSLVMQWVFGLEFGFAFCVISSKLECGRYPAAPMLLDEADEVEGLLQARELITVLEMSEQHGADSGMVTVSRPWWAHHADRRRREANEMEASA